MNEVKEFLMALRKDPKAKAFLKEMQETKNVEEAAEKYVEAAGNLGFSVTKESIMGFLEAEEKQMRKITADAENAVKVALDETDLDAVAGGNGAAGKANEICDSTFLPHEWCWFSDVCSYIINKYNMPVDQGDDTIACEDTILAPKPFDENGWEDIDLECLNNSFMINVQITECYISGTMPNE